MPSSKKKKKEVIRDAHFKKVIRDAQKRPYPLPKTHSFRPYSVLDIQGLHSGRKFSKYITTLGYIPDISSWEKTKTSSNIRNNFVN